MLVVTPLSNIKSTSNPETFPVFHLEDDTYIKDRTVDLPKEQLTLRKTTDLEQEILANLHKLLKHKNSNYGNASLEPLHIFDKSDNSSILSRLDEKLSRVKASTDLRKSDVCDIMGYLVLLCIQKGWISFEEYFN